MQPSYPPASDIHTCVTCSDQAIRARVLELLPDGMARAEMEGSEREINVELVDAGPGDTVLVHADVAIAKE